MHPTVPGQLRPASSSTPPRKGRGHGALMTDPDRPIVLAVVTGAHGVTGEARLKLFCDGPEGLRRYPALQAGGRLLTIRSVRPGPNGAVARFAEIADRNGAEALRGTALTVPRSALPPLGEGEYYHVDLIDLPCHAEGGAPVGRVCAVENFGAGDILEIEKPDGKRFMVPIHAARIEPDRAVIDEAFAA